MIPSWNQAHLFLLTRNAPSLAVDQPARACGGDGRASFGAHGHGAWRAGGGGGGGLL